MEVLSFLEPNYVEVEIGGEQVKFKSISISKLFELRPLLEKLAAGLATVFEDRSRDTRVSNREVGDAKETEIEAIDVELARFRQESLEKSIVSILASITSPDTKKVLGEVLIDSLKPTFKNKNQNPPTDAVAFMDSIPSTKIAKLLEGVYLANKDALAPLFKGVEKKLNIEKRLKKK